MAALTHREVQFIGLTADDWAIAPSWEKFCVQKHGLERRKTDRAELLRLSNRISTRLSTGPCLLPWDGRKDRSTSQGAFSALKEWTLSTQTEKA
jgi:hypothetical protein